MSIDIGKSTITALDLIGKNQGWLAHQMGVSRQRAWEMCNKKPGKSDTIDRLANLFGMESSQFIELGE